MKRIPDNIISIKVDKIKTPKEVWAGDRELLSLYPNGISIEETDYPTDDVLDSIVDLSIERIKDKKIDSRFCVNTQCIDKILSWLVPELEDAWQTKFQELPVFEVLEPKKYLLRIDELEKEVGKNFPVYYPLYNIHNAYFSPFRGSVLFPSRFIINASQKSFIESEWGMVHFQVVLSEELLHALFRQSRGELGDGYVKAIKAIGPQYTGRVYLLSEIIAQHAKEIIARKHPKWALYVISDKIRLVWKREKQREKKEMHDYAGIDALSKKLSLYQIGMIDDMITSNNNLFVNFNPDHPYHSNKQRIFREGIKS